MRQLNKEIVNILAVQGYQTTKQIAVAIDVSERTVRRHLAYMIKNRWIKLIVVPNPILCGFKAWSKIGIKVEPSRLVEVARILVEHPKVYFVAYSFGRFDIIIAVHFDTINKLINFVNIELTAIKGIANSEVLIFAFPRKYENFYWPNPNISNQYEQATDNKNYLPNNLDRNIIDVLGKEVLVPTSIIGSKLGVSNVIIREHIKRMLIGNVLTRQVVMNPKILENQVWATIGIVVNKRNAHEVIDIIMKSPQIYLATISLGRFNVIIAGHFQNIGLLNSFVTHELVSIDGVGSVETFIHDKPLKYYNIPLYDFEARN